MNILGIGTISCCGYGIAALENALRIGWKQPSAIDAPNAPGGKRLVHQVDFDSIPDKSLLKKLRRADRLSKMAVLAAAGAIVDSGIELLQEKKVGIILATAFGAHVTTFDFLDGIIDFGEANVSPTAFSNSVHNAAASYIASSLDIKGPTLTVTGFSFSFQSALQLAKGWLEQGRCDYLLLGAVEQYGDVLGYVSEQKLNSAADGVIKPFVLNPACQVPGEGGVFFLLSREKGINGYCTIEAVTTSTSARTCEPVDLNIIDTNGMLKDESAILNSLDPDTPVSAYSPLYGSLMTGGAFSAAIAALSLRKQTLFAAPEKTNPNQLKVVMETVPATLNVINCLGCNCRGGIAAVTLRTSRTVAPI